MGAGEPGTGTQAPSMAGSNSETRTDSVFTGDVPLSASNARMPDPFNALRSQALDVLTKASTLPHGNRNGPGLIYSG